MSLSLYEVMKADGSSEHINLECIRSVQSIKEGLMEVIFCEGSATVYEANSLMAAFTHSETKVMSFEKAEAE